MRYLNRLLCSDAIRAKLIVIYGKYIGTKKIREVVRRKIRDAGAILIATLIVTLIFIVYGKTEGSETIDAIKRNDYGEGSKTVSLIAEIGSKGVSERVTLNVAAKRYSDDELDAFSDEVSDILPDMILADNESLDMVRTRLNLIDKVKGYPFAISWKIDKPLLVSSKGELDNNRIKEELVKYENKGIPVNLCATISYDEYKCDLYYYALLVGDDSHTLNSFMDELMDSVDSLSISSKAEDYQPLPDKVCGIDVRYKREKGYEAIVVLAVGIISSVLICIAKDREIIKQYNDRNKELERDYSGLLNQYALYYLAGMNPRNIWEEICNKYEEKLKNGGSKRFIYEEMLITRKQFDEGVGELRAYEAFASRCQNVKYRNFINLITQSILKGRDNLDKVLYEEIDRARREENNRIKLSAQELSTKLLVPMVLMLIVVLVIVMVPAFMNFNY